MESKLKRIRLVKNKSIKNHLLKLLSCSLLVFSGLLSNFAIAQSTPACNADIIIHTWGENGRHGTIGDIFAQYSRTNSKVYYFKLIGLDSKQQYSVIPETATSGTNWQYLGVVQPDNRLHNWNESTDYGIGFGVIGNVYSAVNPTTKQTEYFALAALDFSADFSGKISPLPTNSLSNQYWSYLGTTKPTQICDLGCNSQIKLHHWGENNNKGTIGDVYDLYNPFTQNVEYFKLKAVKADGTFGFRPMNKNDNQWWIYLGTGRLDNKVHVWSAGEKGGIGNIYSAINPTTNKVEYFALKALYKKQSGAAKLDTYGELPTNSADNTWWKYLGTTKPTSICDGSANVPVATLDPVVLDSIFYQFIDSDHISIKGQATANANVEITNTTKQVIETATTDANGAFTSSIIADSGDKLVFVVRIDPEFSDPITLIVSAPISVNITYPKTGFNINASQTYVTGTVNAPKNTGVEVNGKNVTLDAKGNFRLDNVALVAGSNTITLSAVNYAGQTTSKSVTGNATLPTQELTVSASEIEGQAPLNVTFYFNNNGYTAQNTDVDVTGDGNVDYSLTPDKTSLNYTYNTPGTYNVTVDAADTNGQSYHTELTIHVLTEAERDQPFLDVWNEFNAQAKAGNIDQAMRFITTDRQPMYFGILTALKPHLTEILDELSTPVDDYYHSTVSSYATGRVENGEVHVYLINAVKDSNNNWRIDGF